MVHEDVTRRIIGAALKVHSAFGAGMLESTYDACLHYQFSVDGLRFDHHVRLPVVYHSVRLDAGYRIDYLVENCVIVELKAAEKLVPIHQAQLMSYLKATGCRLGLLINFHERLLRDGVRRVVHTQADG